VLFTKRHLVLPADHYLLCAKGAVDERRLPVAVGAPGRFVPPGTPFPPASPNCQSWIRNEKPAPDWLTDRKDIVGQPLSDVQCTFTLRGRWFLKPTVWRVGPRRDPRAGRQPTRPRRPPALTPPFTCRRLRPAGLGFPTKKHARA